MISTISPEISSIGTVARKRRRQILQSQRTKVAEDDESPSPKKARTELMTSSPPRKISDAQPQLPCTSPIKTESAPKPKKPQMRYDPDVPMSKEEAAAWRKEQRRKRNRESAAASRQRQRDRITELEQEVSEWKSKYEEALARIEKLEQLREASMVGCSTNTVCSTSEVQPSTAVSPYNSPRHSPSPADLSDSSCAMVSIQEQSPCSGMGSPVACPGMDEQCEHVNHLSEKISRPA